MCIVFYEKKKNIYAIVFLYINKYIECKMELKFKTKSRVFLISVLKLLLVFSCSRFDCI